MIPALLVPSVRPRATLQGAALVGLVGDTRQLTLRQYLIGGGFDDSGTGVTWSTSDDTIAAVSVAGLVTFVRVGSATITATAGGRSYSAILTVSDDFDALIPSTPSILPITFQTTRFNLTQLAGKVSRWGDARGDAYGLPKTQSNPTLQPLISGNLITTDGTTFLQSVASTLLDQTQVGIGICAVLKTQSGGGGVRTFCGIGDTDDDPALLLSHNVSTNGEMGALSNPGTTYSPDTSPAWPSSNGRVGRTLVGKQWLIFAWRTASGVAFCAPPGTPRVVTCTSPSAGAVISAIGRDTAGAVGATTTVSAYVEFLSGASGPSSADLLRYMRWAVAKESALNDAPIRVNLIADSIGYGEALNDKSLNYLTLAMQQTGQLAWSDLNLGFGGKKMSDAVSDFDTMYAPHASASRTLTIWPLVLGVNDLSQARTGLQLYGDAKTVSAKIRALPGNNKIILGTITPNSTFFSGTDATGFETQRQDYRTRVRADSSFYDYLMDLTADTFFGVQAAASDLTKFSDGLHPTAAVHALMQPYLTAGMTAVAA